MPYVDGESLRDRLNREQQLTIADTTRIAADVAGALDYAHKRGVIHRDIKPENILLQDGRPVVADFGIALAVSAAGGNRVTQTGMSLGTPQYMSPEQATGDRQIDARSDVYSLGALTYEMLTGDPPHTGSTTQAIIAKVITEKPTPIHAIRSTVPPQVEFAVDRALAKLPADRWTSAREYADALEGRLSFTAPSSASTSSRRLAIVPWAIAAAALAALAFAWLRKPATPVETPVRFTIESVGDDRARIISAAISPDGQTIAISTATGDSTGLWIKRLDELTPHRLMGSDGGYSPFFSPDGKRVGFLSTDGKVRTLPVEGGSPTVVGTMSNPIGVVWATPDTIVAGMIAFSNVPGLTLLSSGNSQLVPLSKSNARAMHHFPILAPDGKSIVFSLLHHGASDIGIASLDGKIDSITVPSPGIEVPVGIADNTLIYLLKGRLWAVPIDLGGRKITGRPVDLGEQPNDVAFLSRNGTLLYTSNNSADAAILLRPGKAPDTLAINSEAGLVRPRWWPDERSISFGGYGEEGGLYLLDRDSRAITRLDTHRPRMAPAWTPGSGQIIVSDSSGNAVVRSRDGSTAPEPLVAAPSNGNIIHCVVGPDGTTIAMEVEISRRYYVYVSRKGGGPSDAKLLAENARHPEWSPDGKWIVYQSVSDNPGRIVAQGYPAGGIVQISEDAGSHPVWPRGSTVYYEAGQNIMAATVQPSGNGLSITGRRVLYHGKSASTRADSEFANYDVAANGDLIVLEPTSTGRNKVVVELNWVAGLPKKR
jgi:Serine/threonine protein kinase